MTFSPDRLARLGQSQLDALFALSRTAFDATERLIDLHLAAARSTLDASAERSAAWIKARDAQEALALGGALAQPDAAALAGYGRGVCGIAADAGAALSRIVDAQLASGNAQMADLVDFAARAAPRGSEPAVALLRNAAAAAHAVCDSLALAGRQAAGMMEAGTGATAAAAQTGRTKGRKAAA